MNVSHLLRGHWAVIVCVAILAAAGFGASAAVARFLQPRITISERLVDFGYIPKGEEAVRQITISNSGRTNLVIKKVTATCGCSTASLQQSVLSPGQSTSARISVKELAATDGVRKSSVIVVSNDASQPRAEVVVLFEAISTGLVAVPETVSFSRIDRQSLPIRMQLKVTSTDSAGSLGKVDLSYVQDEPFVTALCNSTTVQGEQNVEVMLAADTPSGEIAGWLAFEDRVSGKRLQVKMDGYVRGRYLAIPSSLVLSTPTEPSEGRRERVELRLRSNSDQRPWRVLNVVVSKSLERRVDTSLQSTESGVILHVWGVFPQDPQNAEFGPRLTGYVRVVCEDSAEGVRQEVVNVPVELLCR